jgi:uncharacterized protein YcbK (DUF882 family)
VTTTQSLAERCQKIKLSNDFTLWELIRSTSYPHLVEAPSSEVICALEEFANKVLQPLRDAYGIIVINSGYRNPRLNKAVGGVAASVHTIFNADGSFLGVAADIVPKEVTVEQIFNEIEKHNLPLKTIILYRKPEVTRSKFLHLDTRTDRDKLAKMEKVGKASYSYLSKA